MDAKEFFRTLEANADPGQIAGINHSYLFDITDQGRWLVVLDNGQVTVTPDPSGAAEVEFVTSAETFERLVSGKQNPMMAYMTGKLKISGNLEAAFELKKLF